MPLISEHLKLMTVSPKFKDLFAHMSVCTKYNRFTRYLNILSCFRRFCKCCLEYACRDRTVSYPCHGCLAEDTESYLIDLKTAFLDRGLVKQLSGLAAKCVNQGCHWEGKFSDFVLHEKECQDQDDDDDGHVGADRNGVKRSQSVELSEGLVWRITGFKQKLNCAKMGLVRVIYSDTYIEPKGRYKVGACAYLYGDGMAKGKFMSLFLIIHRSENDDELRWPFSRKVTFALYNQEGESHLVETIDPDHSSSFQRPIKDRNTPSGCPLFCPLDKLDGVDKERAGYVKDDSITIKVIVEPEQVNPDQSED